MTNGPVILRCTNCRTLNRVPFEKLTSHPVCGQCKMPLDFPHAPVTATASAFEREVFDWPEYTLVEFWAKWCGYCRMAEPVVNDLAAWRAGRLKVVKVDVDAEQALARRYSVKATPTFILFRNGTQIARMDGAPKEKLELMQWVDHLMQ